MKKFIAGLLAGLILATCVTVFAEQNANISVIFDRVKLVVNGKMTDTPTMLYDGRTYVQLRGAADAFGAELGWDGDTNTATLTTNSSAIESVPSPTPTQSPIATLKTVSDIEKYLRDTYPAVNTSFGKCKLNYGVMENNYANAPYDFWISVDYDHSFVYDVINNKNSTPADKTKLKQEMKNYMEQIAKDLINKMPGQKLYGTYTYSYYKYPNLQMDLVLYIDCSWTNYGNNTILIPYAKTKASSTVTWIMNVNPYFDN